MVHWRCGSGGGRRVLASAAVLLLFVFASARGDDDCALLAQSGASPTEISKCLLEQTERRPSDPAAWLALGGHFHRIGETQDARTAYKNVIKMAPQSDEAADAHLHMGVIHHSDGEFKEALEYYQNSVGLRPESPNTLLNMASILHLQGDYAEAVRTCKRAIEVDSSYFAVYAQMAILQQSAGDLDDAIATYEKAIELKPDYGPAYFNLGTAFEHAGDLTRAIEQYQMAISLEDGPARANPKFHGRLAAALVEAGHLEREVSQHFDESRHCRPLGARCKHDHHALSPTRDVDPSFLLNVGMVYLDTYLSFQPVELLLEWAAEMLHAAVARTEAASGGSGGAYHAALHALGTCKELVGHAGEAAEAYRAALDARPESALYLSSLKRAEALVAAPDAPDQHSLVEGVRQGRRALHAHVDDAVVLSVDRYGCESPMLTPARVLRRIARSRPEAMSFIAAHVNPFPQVRTLPPDERIVSDPVSEVYGGRGGQQSWGGVLVSSSPWDLQSYKGVLVSPNVTMALEDTSRSPNQTAAILQRHLGPLLADEPARSLDLLRFDNVSCACDAAQAVLGGTAEAPARNPKLVVMQINPTLPPPVRIRVRSAGDERHEGAWGCSLAEATALLARFGYALVQLDYADAMFVLTAHASVIQGLPPNQVSAYQLGFANRGERLRCLGLYRGTMNHPEGDVWARYAEGERTKAEYVAYLRDPGSYIPGNPGRGQPHFGAPGQGPGGERGAGAPR